MVELLVVEICVSEINFSELEILYLFVWLPYKQNMLPFLQKGYFQKLSEGFARILDRKFAACDHCLCQPV